MAPIEFFKALEAKNEILREDYKTQMEAARFIVVHIWNSRNKELRQPEYDPQKFYPFPWEKDIQEHKKQSTQEMKGILEGLAILHKDAIVKETK